MTQRITEESAQHAHKEKTQPMSDREFWFMLFILALINFNEAFQMNCIWPFLPFMVEDFGISEQYNATYVGLLASTFFFCQFATSILWGAASDKFGRRPCLLWGVALNGVAMVQFGFSSSYALAVLGRALAGGLSGNVAISKSYLGEVTAGSRSAKGFGLLGFVWGIGSVTAPIAGGYLSNPTSRYPAVFPGDKLPVLVDFPYLLPSVLSALVACIALVAGLFFLPETQAFLQRKQQVTAPSAPGPCRAVSGSLSKALQWLKPGPRTQMYQSVSTVAPSAGAAAGAVAHARAPASQELDVELPVIDMGPSEPCVVEQTPPNSEQTLTASSAPVATTQPQMPITGPSLGLRRCSCTGWLLSRGISHSTALCIASYACVAMAQVLFDEMMPIFAKTKGEGGGLSFDSGQVGLVLTLQGAALIVYQPVFFPIIVQRVGAVRLFSYSALLLVPAFFFFPTLTLVYSTPGALWPALAFVIIAKACLLANMFTSILMLTNRSAKGANLGKVNGVSQSSSAAVRSVSPFVGGVLYSMSTGLPGRLHAMLPYTLPTVVLLVCAWLSNKIPASLNFEEDEPSTTPAEGAPSSEQAAEDDTKGLLQPNKRHEHGNSPGIEQPPAQFAQLTSTDPHEDSTLASAHLPL